MLRDDFFLQTAQALGRRPAEDGRARKRRKGLVGERRCAGSFTDSFVTTLAFPDGEFLPKPREVAASHGVSWETVNRARQVAANVLACEAEEKLTRLSEASAGAMAQKLSWDETSLHFYNPERLRSLLSPEMCETYCPEACEVDELDKKCKEAQGAPITMNVMQAATHLMIDDFSAEMPLGPRILRNTQADEMCSALVPLFRNDLLEKAADPDERASRVVGLYGDSARANKLVVTELADKVGCPVVDGLCLAHQISMVCEEIGKGRSKAEVSVETGMHATRKLMDLFNARNALFKKLTRLAKRAKIYRGVAPPVVGREFAREVFDVAFKEFSREPFGDDDFETDKDTTTAFTLVMDTFNGDWTQPVWEHYCCRDGANDRRPCCKSVAQSRFKMRSRMHRALQKSTLMKLPSGTKKWGQSMTSCRKYSFFTNCHDTWGQAICAWESQHGERDGGGNSSSDEHRADGFELRNRKRKKKATKFWRNESTKRLITSTLRDHNLCLGALTPP